MAKLEAHERISTNIVATSPRGYNIKAFSLVGKEGEYARYLIDTGHTNVAIVTEKSTWRGKNGKRTTTEIARIEIS